MPAKDAEDLDELAEYSEPSVAAVERTEDVDGRDTLILYLSDLSKYTVIEEKNTLPAWASIVGVHVLVGEDVPEGIDADSVVSIAIEDARERHVELANTLTASEMRDYVAIEEYGMAAREWERQTGVDHSNASKHASRAWQKMQM